MNIEKFTINASKRIDESKNLANKKKNNQINSSHLLYSILSSTDSIMKEIFRESKIDIKALSTSIKREIDKLSTIE
ncbi:hypothetical protein HOF65_04845 [bacterium]|jgi:ATP-dependent Clp protease ATP-binding subunit ClpA|nr:hypothetical protein [bacterium]MBT3853283.1 hypothetical protein [bacterium]